MSCREAKRTLTLCKELSPSRAPPFPLGAPSQPTLPQSLRPPRASNPRGAGCWRHSRRTQLQGPASGRAWPPAGAPPTGATRRRPRPTGDAERARPGRPGSWCSGGWGECAYPTPPLLCPGPGPHPAGPSPSLRRARPVRARAAPQPATPGTARLPPWSWRTVWCTRRSPAAPGP